MLETAAPFVCCQRGEFLHHIQILRSCRYGALTGAKELGKYVNMYKVYLMNSQIHPQRATTNRFVWCSLWAKTMRDPKVKVSLPLWEWCHTKLLPKHVSGKCYRYIYSYACGMFLLDTMNVSTWSRLCVFSRYFRVCSSYLWAAIKLFYEYVQVLPAVTFPFPFTSFTLPIPHSISSAWKYRKKTTKISCAIRVELGNLTVVGYFK